MDARADAIIALYERNAAAWDDDRQRSRPEGERPWIKRFAGAAAPGATLLDLGCGSGRPMAADLIAAGHAVTGIDSSPALIALCRQRFPVHDWLVADMRRLDLQRRFGGILAWNSLFHLTPEDQEGMFPLFARHLADGAPLIFTSGPWRGVSIGHWQGEPLYHASLDPGEYEGLLASNGFRLVEHVAEDATCGGATVWLAKRTGARSP